MLSNVGGVGVGGGKCSGRAAFIFLSLKKIGFGP